MAKKNGSYYPCNKTMRLAMASPATQAGYVQVDYELSKINRRLYRQGRVYQVKVDLDGGAAGGTGYHVYAINNTWMLKKAWQTAKETYDEQTLAERNVFNGKMARWRDFRLALSNSYTGAGSLQATRFDEAGNEVRLVTGEYETSKVEDDAGNAKEFSLVESSSRFNILKEFDLTGRADTDPGTATTAVAYDGLDTDLNDAEVEDITGNGNAPPYAQNDSHWNYPLVKVGELHSAAEGQKLSTGYFDAPLGFVVLVRTAGAHSAEGQSEITVTAKGGDYKGVAAHSLLE